MGGVTAVRSGGDVVRRGPEERGWWQAVSGARPLSRGQMCVLCSQGGGISYRPGSEHKGVRQPEGAFLSCTVLLLLLVPRGWRPGGGGA